MAADILAGELGLDLYKIDLSTVVSKYIGETEKNLARIFAEASDQQRDPVLRRGRRAVRQAHRGARRARPVRQHRDQLPAAEDGGVRGRGHPGHEPAQEHGRGVRAPAAFHGGVPDSRRGGPAAHLGHRSGPRRPRATPASTSTCSPEQVELAGGNIRNIALASAFLAAADGGTVTMRHVRDAVRREYQKIGKVLTPNDLDATGGSRHAHEAG